VLERILNQADVVDVGDIVHIAAPEDVYEGVR